MGTVRVREWRVRPACGAAQAEVSESSLTFLGRSGVPSRRSVDARTLAFRPRALRGAGRPRKCGVWRGAPLVSELPVAFNSFCFIIVILFCFVFVLRNGIRTSCFSEVSGDRVGTNRAHRGTLFPCGGGGPGGRLPLPQLPQTCPPDHSSPPSYQNVPHCPRVSLDDACGSVQHRIDRAQRGRPGGVQANALLATHTLLPPPRHTCRRLPISLSLSSFTMRALAPEPSRSESRYKRATFPKP